MDLTGGISNYRGVYFTGSVDGATLAAYAYREKPGAPVSCLVGKSDEVLPAFKADKQNERPDADSLSTKDVFLPALVGIVLIVLMAVFGGQLSYTLGMLVFAVVAYYPVESLLVALKDSRIHTAEFEQYRRNHGAEHTVGQYWRKNKKNEAALWTAEDLARYSYLDPECGTIWISSLLIFAIVLGVVIAFGPALGLLTAFLVVVVALVVLLVNIWANPANPLKNIQKAEVAKPTAYELETALAAYKALEHGLADVDKKGSDPNL